MIQPAEIAPRGTYELVVAPRFVDAKAEARRRGARWAAGTEGAELGDHPMPDVPVVAVAGDFWGLPYGAKIAAAWHAPTTILCMRGGQFIETDVADRAALRDLLKLTRMNKESRRMGVPTDLLDAEAAARVDTEVQRLTTEADRSAASSGSAYRNAMRSLVETQADEIDRLRGIIARYAADHPRKPMSIAAGGHGVVVVASDFTIWTATDTSPNAAWSQLADLPQPSEELNDE